MSQILVSLGNKIRELRKSKGFTQESLSEKANLHPTYVGAIERGEANVSLNTLQKIADALTINIGDLFPFNLPQKPTTESELLAFQILGLVRNQDPEIQRPILNLLKPLIDELRKMNSG